jgi:AbrB family looped-hinge helix DNA binding protein
MIARLKVSKRGAITIPAELRRMWGIFEGSVVSVEATDDGILIKPFDAWPVEIYTPERIAEFLLSSTLDADDYERVREEVIRLGLNPDDILHEKPEDSATEN